MKALVGPVYVAHPYSAPTPEGREANVRSAATLSSALNAVGCVTISPLQESRGRESALLECQWVGHGLVQLHVCIAAVFSENWQESRGCSAEHELADGYGIPIFYAFPDSSEPSGWHLDGDLLEWLDSERTEAAS